MFERLRAVLTPQAAALLAALLLACALFFPKEGTELEARAGRVLSKMEGAGKVDVVVMTAKRAGTWGGTEEEVPCGAVAVAQGADDPLVNIQLTQALCTLLGLPSSAVSVIAAGK